MISNKLDSLKIDCYLFWWRFKDLFLFCPIVIIVTVFLSFTMVERFDKLEKTTGQSFDQLQGTTLRENTK